MKKGDFVYGTAGAGTDMTCLIRSSRHGTVPFDSTKNMSFEWSELSHWSPILGANHCSQEWWAMPKTSE